MSVSPTFFSEPAEAKGEARNEPTKPEAEAEGEARNEQASGSESGSSNRSERTKRAMLSPLKKTGLSARA